MIRKAFTAMAVFLIVVWINNSSFFVRVDDRQGPRLLAHRGVHQIYARTELENDTCTALPVRQIEHPFIENTIPSMRAAFHAGADVVELDVHLTPDNAFAVFHDWTLDCRTNGRGQTNETSFDILRTLDVGHGYSADGETFPLRGAGIGLMPSLIDVLEAFPEGRFLINFKSGRRKEGDALVRLLRDRPAYKRQIFGVYGGQSPTRAALAGLPELRGYDKASLTSCLVRYTAIGWTGITPEICRNRLLAIPINVAPFLWGWPYRFQDRMANAGTSVILVGSYYGGGFSSGIDDPALLENVPERFFGYVWTNEIEKIGPLVQ